MCPQLLHLKELLYDTIETCFRIYIIHTYEAGSAFRSVLELKKGEAMAGFSHFVTIIYFRKTVEE